MFRITNIESLGTEYTISDAVGNVIKTIHVIPYDEILEASGGAYTDGKISAYIQNAKSLLEGTEEISRHRVMWFATKSDEMVLSELVQKALEGGYDIIVLEHLAD